MKRRLDESNKPDNLVFHSTSVRHQVGNTPLSSHVGNSRIVSSHAGVPTVVQSTGVTSKERSNMPGSVQFPLQATYSGATSTPVKVSSQGLQGGSPVTTLQAQAHQQHTLHQAQAHQQIRHKVHTGAPAATPPMAASGQAQPLQNQFQRLKVEDALSYLDQVKYKFGNQPQVYNDFLDIMKEFKSQSIDTPGVIQRVSNLFEGHPELIVGFNTFLPPGYKIEVQANDQGYAFQVSLSMPSPTAVSTTLVHTPRAAPPLHVPAPPPSLGSPVALPTPPNQSSTSASVKSPPGLQPVHGTSAATSHHTIVSTGVGITASVAAATAAPASNSSQHSHHSIVVPVPALYQPPPSGPPTPVTTASTVTSTTQSTGSAGPVTKTSAATSTHHANNSHHQHSAAATFAAHQAVSQALSHSDPAAIHTPQPVEFTHAITYVNKIKNRFQAQPDKYKRFLEILHTYQMEQRNLKDGLPVGGPHLTEAEVYAQVAKLFEHQEDLLAEFGQFLPDATSHQAALGSKSSGSDHTGISKKTSGLKSSYNNSACGGSGSRETFVERGGMGSGGKFGHTGGQVKRSPSFSGSSQSHCPPTKKQKTASLRDVTLAEAAKYATLNEYAFFDKARKSMKNQEVYENFLRCLILFNNELVSKGELTQLVTPFLAKFPELFSWFKNFLGQTDSTGACSSQGGGSSQGMDAVPNNVARQGCPVGDLAMEIDYTTCKRLGASYCALPKSYVQPKCSGRTLLCREVLNDQWVSFPTWSSEDSTFVTSRKTQYEEYIYRCEDERFELDVVIETNAATIRVLEGVNKKISRMPSEEAAKYRLDDYLGSTSQTIHQRSIRRIYGDKAQDIIDGLKKNPMVAVPVVLRRLKSKDEEWREAQKGFNKIWREQNEKYYLKSLDHQGMNFKQTDVKSLRSKNLFNDIETLYDERHEQAEESAAGAVVGGPHLVLPYKDRAVLDDAANLLIHHVKRQTTIHKEDKTRIKQLLRRFLPDLFFHPRQELSEDERDEDDKDDELDRSLSSGSISSPPGKGRKGDSPAKKEPDAGGGDPRAGEPSHLPAHARSSHPDECYRLFFGNNHWYLFLRLHQILCERLTKIYERALIMTAESEAKGPADKSGEPPAISLRLRPKGDLEIEDFYPAFLDMVKNVLDGNMDSTAYEDTLREMFGIHAYIAFTLDKVVSYAVRQLQHLVTDDASQECIEMLHQELRRAGAGGPCITAAHRTTAEMAYQRRAEQALADENCFKIYVYKVECKVTIELLDTDLEEHDPATDVEKWSSYVECYTNPSGDGMAGSSSMGVGAERSDHMDLSGDEAEELDGLMETARRRKLTFLPRNVRQWRLRSGCQQLIHTAKENHTSAADDDCKDKSSNSEDKIPTRPKGVVNNSGSTVATGSNQCHFNINTFRLVYVVNKENFLYKRGSLVQARHAHPTVAPRLSAKFRDWHSEWSAEHVTDGQHRACVDWLMGRGEVVMPHRTRVYMNNDINLPPYHVYNRYRVDRHVSSASSGEQ